MGYQRIVNKLGDLRSFGADPRQVVYAGHNVDGIDRSDLQVNTRPPQVHNKERYQSFDLEYKGRKNNDYVNGQRILLHGQSPLGRTIARTVSDTKDGETEKVNLFLSQRPFGSSSLITNDGEVTQHVEYIPYGEVFWRNATTREYSVLIQCQRELDEEAGLAIMEQIFESDGCDVALC